MNTELQTNMTHADVVEELKNILNKLPRTNNSLSDTLPPCICYCTANSALHLLIRSRLCTNEQRFMTVRNYLEYLQDLDPNSTFHSYSFTEVQDFRHAWVKELILEFSAHPTKKFDPLDNSNAHAYPGIPYV